MAQRTGSTRIITSVRQGVVEFRYTCQWSVFDRGKSPQRIDGFDTSRAQCAVLLFQAALKAGIKTHYIDQVDERTFLVNEYRVPTAELLSGQALGRVIELEWLYRLRAAGSMIDRIERGEAKPEDFGFEPGTTVTLGMKLPKLHIECTTKFEDVDRHLSASQAMELAGLSAKEWAAAIATVTQVAELVEKVYAAAGFDIYDGKCELGYNPRVGIVVVDVFGSQDENRILDAKTGDLYCKDILRNKLRSMPWFNELSAAKAAYPNDKAKWPPYPWLDAEFLEVVSAHYLAVPARLLESFSRK